MELSDLSAQQQEILKNAKGPKDVFALAQEEGIELSDDDLEKVSGGWSGSGGGGITCRVCGSSDVAIESVGGGSYTGEEYICDNCGERWSVS